MRFGVGHSVPPSPLWQIEVIRVVMSILGLVVHDLVVRGRRLVLVLVRTLTLTPALTLALVLGRMGFGIMAIVVRGVYQRRSLIRPFFAINRLVVGLLVVMVIGLVVMVGGGMEEMCIRKEGSYWRLRAFKHTIHGAQ
jgi:hypothetical protein